MDFVIYFYIFLMGITFGSFFTLAVYRIPLGQDITHNRSYCPNCNHKLSNLDLIPLFSYIFLICILQDSYILIKNAYVFYYKIVLYIQTHHVLFLQL